MANMKCNLTEEEWPRIFMEFDGHLSDKEEDELDGKFRQYCFYESWGRKNFRECSCTVCGGFEVYKDEAEEFFGHKHGDRVLCPNCGNRVELYALGRMRTGSCLKEYQRAAFIRPSSDGGVLLTAGFATKDYSPYDLRPVIEWYEKSRTYLAPGKRGQWKRQIANYWNAFYCAEASGWERTKTVAEPFVPAMMQHDGSYWLFGLNNLYDSKLQYCQLQEWYREITGTWLCEEAETVRQVYKYLACYTEYPQMEMAVKVEMHRAVEELVMEGLKNHQCLNWRANSLHDFLRMTKWDAKHFVAAGGDIDQLRHYRDAESKGYVKNTWEYLGLINDVCGTQNIDRAASCANKAGVDIKKAVRYVKKVSEHGSMAGVLHIWNDYLDMAKKLELDLTEATVAMPKDLQQRHDTCATMIKVQASAEERKKYQKRYEALKKRYEFQLGGLCIVVPESSEAILLEGKTLKHCVGGYADRHMNGTLDILFLRNARKRNRSFLTIELHQPKTGVGRPTLVQIHGYRNERYQGAPVDPKVKYNWFLETWLEWVKQGSCRDKKGQPIIQTGKEQTA